MADNTDRNDAFEKFFKKKAEEYDIAYREQDWLKLEKKLDLKDAQISYQRKIRWITAASLLIVALLGYFTYENYNKINQLNQLLNEGITSTEESAPVPEIPDENSNVIPDSDPEPGEDLAESPPSDHENESNTSPANPDENLEPFTVSEPEAIPNRERAFVEKHETAPSDLPGLGMKKLSNTFFVSDSSNAPGDYNAAVDVKPQPPVASAYPADPGFGQSDASRFTMSLLVSPDLSTVGTVSNFHDPGYKIGLGVNYQLTSKLSLSTGVIHSDVRYTANGSDYAPSTAYSRRSNNTVSPSQVLAECLILDIPVNLNYEFLQFSRSRFFASAGLSSYIMMDEKYDFSYETDYPGQAESWSGQTGTLHLFSNAGFSLGYQVDVTRHWGLQIEPFVRVPLRKVGWGNVKLYSMGSFVSINYKL